MGVATQVSISTHINLLPLFFTSQDKGLIVDETPFGYHTCSKSQGKNQREGSSISAIDPAFLQDGRTS